MLTPLPHALQVQGGVRGWVARAAVPGENASLVGQDGDDGVRTCQPCKTRMSETTLAEGTGTAAAGRIPHNHREQCGVFGAPET